tara:strand:- start:4888 stop:5436 length:549 start_codon:yes stop_codon:yes gene_type:complete
MLLISIAIILESKGGAIFKQKRIGKNKKIFTIYKFRSMYLNDSEIINQYKQVVLSDESDKRITKVGLIIRKTSFDEIPQLFNILKGQMSFIGPRPILEEQLDAMEGIFHKRFSLLPGLSGLAQIKGRRKLNWLKQLQFDNEYIENVSFYLDFLIFIRTFFVLFSVNDIYGNDLDNWRNYLKK